MRTKERKIVFSELLPWHKEVTQGFQGPQTIRMAETSLGFTNTSLPPRPTCALAMHGHTSVSYFKAHVTQN